MYCNVAKEKEVTRDVLKRFGKSMKSKRVSVILGYILSSLVVDSRMLTLVRHCQ